jgi:hypothetical protein
MVGEDEATIHAAPPARAAQRIQPLAKASL